MQRKKDFDNSARSNRLHGWKAWLPSRGNVLFTLLVAASLLWVTNVGALPSQAPLAAGTSKTTINYQGYLTDSDGNPVTETVEMVFRLYNSETGGEAQWTETQTVEVADGLFNVLLGEASAIPANVIANNDDLWLGIAVGGDTEMSPRDKIASSPYAMLSNVPDGSITQSKLAGNSVNSAKIQDGEVFSSDVGFNYAGSSSKGGPASNVACSNCISSGEIDDGQVTSADIANNTISEADIRDDFKARNADKLDGKNSTDFAGSGHRHDGRYYTESESDSRFSSSGHRHDGRYYTESESDSRFAGSGHNHDGRYYTEGQSNNRFVNASGDGMSGNLDMNGRDLVDVHKVQIGGQGTITDKKDNANGGPHMVFDTDDCFTFQNGDGMRLRLCGSQHGQSYLGRTWHYFNDTIVPTQDNSYDLGGAGNRRWRSLYVMNVYQGDLAEDIDLGYDNPETGEVVVWQDGKLVRSTQSYDRNVFGVAKVTEDRPTGAPAILGIFTIKVTGEVEEGDFLVTSDVPGHAMASENPEIGTVIATALESFKGESGLIKAMIRKF